MMVTMKISPPNHFHIIVAWKPEMFPCIRSDFTTLTNNMHDSVYGVVYRERNAQSILTVTKKRVLIDERSLQTPINKATRPVIDPFLNHPT